MPKIKTHSASAKRFSLTKSGKVKRGSAYRRHKLTEKTTKRKRILGQSVYASTANEATIKKMIPYK